MATAIKLKSDIKKLKKAIETKGISDSIKSKLRVQLEKAENELASMQKGGKPRKVSTTKSTASTLSALQKLIKRKKYSAYQGKGVDLKKDAGQGALPYGKRESKGLKANQFGDKGDNKGNVYYEYRANRLDVKQPSKKARYPKLEKGGRIDNFSDKIQEGDIVWDSNNKRYGVVLNTYDYKYGEIRLDSDGNQPIEDLYKLGSEGDKGTKEKLKEALLAHKRLMIEYPDRYDKVNYASGGMMARGGYVAVGEKDGYWTIMSKPTTKEMAQEVIDMGVPRGEVGKVVSVQEAKSHKKVIGAEYLENGGIMAMGGVTRTKANIIFKQYKRNEDNNDHSENVVLLAKHFGTDEDLTLAKKIQKKHDDLGHAPQSLLAERDELAKKLYKRMVVASSKMSGASEGKKMAKGGGIYSSDSLYILTVSKDGDKVGEKRFQAKNLKEARIIGEDFEDEFKEKFGGDLSFSLREAMADGGKIPDNYDGKEPKEIWDSMSKMQKQHFIYDHATEIEDYRGGKELSSKEIMAAYNSDFENLDKNIRNRFENHVRMGQYAKGGKTKQNRYNYGRAWAADRAKHNKSEDYEIPMNKRRLEEGGVISTTHRMS